MSPFTRKVPGSRPAAPFRQQAPPDDWLCTWSYRLPVWSAPAPAEGVWELKFVHACCAQHGFGLLAVA